MWPARGRPRNAGCSTILTGRQPLEVRAGSGVGWFVMALIKAAACPARKARLLVVLGVPPFGRIRAYGECDMRTEDEIREFLTTRRARLTPTQAGLPVYGRRVASRGCAARRSRCSPASASSTTRASSAATRAASPTRCSTRVCTRAPARRGRAGPPASISPVTANAVGRPGRATRPSDVSGRASGGSWTLSLSIPALVSNGRLDILYANPFAEALYSEHFRDPFRPVNSARFMFLDPRAPDVLPGLGEDGS